VTATLTVRPAPEAGPGARCFELDCPHGTTQALLIPGQAVPTDGALIRYLIERHHRQERCACTHNLRRKYGLFGRDQ